MRFKSLRKLTLIGALILASSALGNSYSFENLELTKKIFGDNTQNRCVVLSKNSLDIKKYDEYLNEIIAKYFESVKNRNYHYISSIEVPIRQSRTNPQQLAKLFAKIETIYEQRVYYEPAFVAATFVKSPSIFSGPYLPCEGADAGFTSNSRHRVSFHVGVNIFTKDKQKVGLVVALIEKFKDTYVIANIHQVSFQSGFSLTNGYHVTESEHLSSPPIHREMMRTGRGDGDLEDVGWGERLSDLLVNKKACTEIIKPDFLQTSSDQRQVYRMLDPLIKSVANLDINGIKNYTSPSNKKLYFLEAFILDLKKTYGERITLNSTSVLVLPPLVSRKEKVQCGNDLVITGHWSQKKPSLALVHGFSGSKQSGKLLVHLRPYMNKMFISEIQHMRNALNSDMAEVVKKVREAEQRDDFFSSVFMYDHLIQLLSERHEFGPRGWSQESSEKNDGSIPRSRKNLSDGLIPGLGEMDLEQAKKSKRDNEGELYHQIEEILSLYKLRDLKFIQPGESGSSRWEVIVQAVFDESALKDLDRTKTCRDIEKKIRSVTTRRDFVNVKCVLGDVVGPGSKARKKEIRDARRRMTFWFYYLYFSIMLSFGILYSDEFKKLEKFRRQLSSGNIKIKSFRPVSSLERLGMKAAVEFIPLIGWYYGGLYFFEEWGLKNKDLSLEVSIYILVCFFAHFCIRMVVDYLTVQSLIRNARVSQNIANGLFNDAFWFACKQHLSVAFVLVVIFTIEYAKKVS